MNLKCKQIIEEYKAQRSSFEKLGDVVQAAIKKAVTESKMEVLAIEHRVKTEESLTGKLELKGDKYNSLDDITDILGFRIITIYSDDVDKIAAKIEKLFEIDWKNSVDKRAALNTDEFGYMSMHYICYLSEEKGYPKELCGLKFELQMRSTLQHVWAQIEHDLGYKTDFEIPRPIKREFYMLASILELADSKFVSIRDTIGQYEQEIIKRIENDEAADISIDKVSLRIYNKANKNIQKLVEKIAAICNSEIKAVTEETYIEQLAWFGIKKLGQLQKMIEEDSELAYKLAKNALENTDLDILSSNVGLLYLCRAHLLNNNYSKEQCAEFFNISDSNLPRCLRTAERLFKIKEQI